VSAPAEVKVASATFTGAATLAAVPVKVPEAAGPAKE